MSQSTDPILYLYTSLTAGSSHIVTATSRLETILRANRIPFKGLDVATDEKARMLWGRRAGKDESGRQRKLPGLVQMGLVIGDIVEVEDWNEYGELKQHVKIVPIDGFKTAPAAPPIKPSTSKAKSTSKAAGKSGTKQTEKGADIPGAQPTDFTMAMKSVGEEAAAKAKKTKKVVTKKVPKAVDPPVKEPDTLAEEKSAMVPKSYGDTWAMYTDSVLQGEDGLWSRRSGLVEDGPISSVIESMGALMIESRESLQSPTSGTWKNNPLGSIGSIGSIVGGS